MVFRAPTTKSHSCANTLTLRRAAADTGAHGHLSEQRIARNNGSHRRQGDTFPSATLPTAPRQAC